MAIHSAPRSRTRPWSHLFYNSYPKIDGLYYSSSMNRNESMIALYERATSALPKRPEIDRALSDRNLAPYIAEVGIKLGYFVWPPA